VAALSVALTALVLRLLSCPAPRRPALPPLIVSLGLLTLATELLAIAEGTLLLIVLGVALNRLLGVR
jgi:hypothetical protein